MDAENKSKGKENDEFSTVNTFIFLLSSPYCWKSARLSHFLRACHNHVKENPDESIKSFKENLDKHEATKFIWSPMDNWQDVLDPTDFAILTKVKGKPMRSICNTSVLCLLRIIRNKYEHWNEFKEDEKQKLDWFIPSPGGKLELDEHLFSTYWTEKFPELVAYLWQQFAIFGGCSTLAEFYPFNLETVLNWNNFGMVEFLHQLLQACSKQVDEGWMENRFEFKTENVNIKVEFRSLPESVFNSALVAGMITVIQIQDDRVTVKCQEKGQKCKKLTYKFAFDGTHKKSKYWDITTDIGLIVIANQLQQIENSELFSVLDISSINACNSIVFRNRGFPRDSMQEENIAKRFAFAFDVKVAPVYLPVAWNDLSSTTKEKILTSDFRIHFQNNAILFNEALPNGSEARENLLSILTGGKLNSFVSSKQLQVLKMNELDKAPSIYLERKIINRAILSSSICIHDFEDILIIFGLSIEKYQTSISTNIDKICTVTDVATLPDNIGGKILLVNCNNTNLEQTYRKLNQNRGSKNIHCLRYLSDGTIKWLKTLGSFSHFECLLLQASKEIGLVSEDDLLKSLPEKGESVIFIADMPGMGKSQILSSLARRLSQQLENCYILCISMNDFLNALYKTGDECIENVNAYSIENVLISLCCNDKFESELFRFWLHEQCSVKIKFEVMLDGIDEVIYSNRRLALEILQTLQNSSSSVRVWAAVRDHMLEDIRIEFNCLGYKLEPFTEDDQVSYLERHWLQYWKSCKNDEKPPCSEKLQQFARLCVTVPLSGEENAIAGIPLQCRMIAEINERKIIEQNFTLDKTSGYNLIDLYKQMIERKLEVYLNEKNLISTVPMNHYIACILRADIERLNIYFAIKLIFSENSANKFKNLLLITSKDENMLNCAILDLGLVQKLDPLMFIHRTFAEYIVAQFVYKGLQGNFLGLNPLQEDFQSFVWDEVFCVGDKYEQFKFPTICHFLNALCEENCQNLKALNTMLDYVNDITVKYLDGRRHRDCNDALFYSISPLFYSASKTKYKNLSSMFIKFARPALSLVAAALTFLTCPDDDDDYNEILTINASEFALNFRDIILSDKLFVGYQNWKMLQNLNQLGFGPLHWIIHGIKVFYNNFEEYNLPEELVDFIKYLVSKDKSVLEHVDNEGMTPLLATVHLGITEENDTNDFPYGNAVAELTKLLVKDLRANVNAEDKDGDTVFHYLNYIDYTIFRKINCFAINSKNHKGNTPLIHAIKSFIKNESVSSELFKKFKNLSADLNLKDLDGNTALHVAISLKLNAVLVNQLITLGSNVAIQNDKGQTPMHLAVENNRVAIAKILVNQAPGCLYIKDKQGKLPGDYIVSNVMYKYLQFKLANCTLVQYCTFNESRSNCSDMYRVNKVSNVDFASIGYFQAKCLSPNVSVNRSTPSFLYESRFLALSDSEFEKSLSGSEEIDNSDEEYDFYNLYQNDNFEGNDYLDTSYDSEKSIDSNKNVGDLDENHDLDENYDLSINDYSNKSDDSDDNYDLENDDLDENYDLSINDYSNKSDDSDDNYDLENDDFDEPDDSDE